MQVRKTKIICTLGPASESEEVIRELILKGMNVARLNFSHGSYKEHKVRIDLIKSLREELNKPVAILLDTKGPEIRTGEFQNGKCILKSGEKIVIRNKDIEGTEKEFSINYKDLHKDVFSNSRILIDDGLIELTVESIKNEDIYCRIVNGGPVSNHKSMNIPGVELHLPSFTEKDREDILFAIRENFDFVAVSFARKARDIQAVRAILEKEGGAGIQIIAKIENGEGVNNFEDIVKVSDGIMVARGDLGVEIAPEDVPILQKRFIRQCQNSGKISITATQMLDSMIRNPRPTRAEVSDVANAIFDGTSAVMLSGETAAGKYPTESLLLMAEIIQRAENSINFWQEMVDKRFSLIPTMANAISHATCMTAMDLNASAIVTLTLAGHTAQLVSRFHPGCPIIASTTNPRVLRQLNLCWAVCPILVTETSDVDTVLDASINHSIDQGFLNDGDTVVATFGTPLGISGTTNTIRVKNIGHYYVSGKGQPSSDPTRNRITGNVKIIRNPEIITEELSQNLPPNLILVAPYTNNQMMPLIRNAIALVVEDDDPTSHSSTAAMALDIPVILSCGNATKILKDDYTITLDAMKGIVT